MGDGSSVQNTDVGTIKKQATRLLKILYKRSIGDMSLIMIFLYGFSKGLRGNDRGRNKWLFLLFPGVANVNNTQLVIK